MRARLLSLGVGVVSAALNLHGSNAWALDERHPQFDDRGTLAWTTDARLALGAAAAQRRTVLVVSGALDDAATRDLVTRVIPDAQVAPRLRALCVGLALDSRRADPLIDPLFTAALGLGTTTPAVAFIHADGRWITGFRGAAALPRFLQHLALAERLAAPAPAQLRSDDAHLPAPVQRALVPPASAARPGPAAPPSLSAPDMRSAPNPRRAPTDDNPRLSSLVERAPDALPATPAARAPTPRAPTWPPTRASTPALPPLPQVTAPPDTRAADAERSRHARAGLDRALSQVLAGDRAGAVNTLRGVNLEAAGLPEALEAERGIDAILTAADLGRLADPSSVLAETLRRTKRDELRGTRWARLFAG